jgi:thiamine-phosphate pyrophosphorylase
MASNRLHGLYIVLDPGATGGRSLEDVLKAASDGGARLFQYRDKHASGLEMYRRATVLRRTTADVGAVLVINDRCDLALAVEADGVHLGQRDLPVAHARSLLGPGRIIGLSTHRAADVTAAASSGADYLGFGPIFPTSTKPDHEPVVGVDGLSAIRRLTSLPIFAIGGVTLQTVPAIMQAGADGVAVLSAIGTAPDVTGTVRAFLKSLESASRPAPQ